MNQRDKSYEDGLIDNLRDLQEAAAYIDAIMELEDPTALALALALRQVAKAHGMAEVARRAEVGENPVPLAGRER